jgi:hypothetical protein
VDIHGCILVIFVDQTTYILDLGFRLLKQLVLVVGLTIKTLSADVEVARLAGVNVFRCLLAAIAHDIVLDPFLV